MLGPHVATTLTATSLHDRVYEELRARLLTRRHVPGEKLSLHELASELGVSRSPVHHALTRLVSEGLLTVKARRGYFVTPVTADALAEGYEVRLALELHAADRAVGRVASEDLTSVPLLLEDTAAAISHQRWDGANAAFEHQIDLAANALLSRFYRELSVDLMMQVIRGGHLEDHAGLVTEHRRIVEAFRSRRPRQRETHPRARRDGQAHRPRRNRPRRRCPLPFTVPGTMGRKSRSLHRGASPPPPYDAPMATAEDRRLTDSGIEIAPVYTADDLPAPALELPGEHPFTRGQYATMYRGRPWTIRQYAGYGLRRRRTRASAICSSAVRQTSPWPSTCRRSSGTTRTTRSPTARSGGRGWRSTRSPTWRCCSRGSRSARCRRR